MNIKSTLAAITLAASTFFVPSAQASVEDTAIREGRVGGYNAIVTDTLYWDTIVIPFPGRYPGVVLVRCSTGDFRYNEEIGAVSARSIAIDYCH